MAPLRSPSFTLDHRVRLLIIAAIATAFILQNLRVLQSATGVMLYGFPAGNNEANDFGAFYTAAWRLVHNPSQIYAYGYVQGDPLLGANATQFKYLPFYSFMMVPLLSLEYTSALLAWNAFQFALLPITALLLYKSLKSFNIVVIVAVLWIVLLQPLPYPPQYAISLFRLYTSQSYYWQWAEGQSKVFMTFLVSAAYFLSKNKRPYLAGLAYGLSFFDPRFPLYAVPLMLLANRGQYRRVLVATVLTLLVGDAVLLYDGLGSSFLTMVEGSGASTGFFQYTWIPFFTIATLTAVESFAFIAPALRGRMKSVPLSP